jgi:DNA-directed RNA polymerase subunit E'/Rpb7
LTVEEPQITDAESVTTNPEDAGTETETATTPPEAAATDVAPVEAETEVEPAIGEAAAVVEPDVSGQADEPVEELVLGASQPDEEPGRLAASTAIAAEEVADAPAAVSDEEDGEADAVPAAAPVPAVPIDRPEPTTMEELLAQQSGDIPSLKHGDVVEGTIVRIDKDEMLVDVGAKSEGVVSNRELYGRNAETQPELHVGDTVLVYVLQPESTDGHAVLSLRRAGLERKWRAMQEQFDAGEIIDAPVIDHNKGGLIVDCGIRGFVPISQIVDFPRRPQNDQPRDAAQEIAEKLQPYVGRRLRLKILEVNRKANRLILS